MIEIKHKDTGRVLLRIDADSLMGAALHGLQLGGADLRGADLRHINFGPAARSEQFDALILAGLRWTGRGADLSDADLIGARLQSAWLVLANLRNANLTNANREDATVAASDLAGANLTGANLATTHLQVPVTTNSAWIVGNDLTDLICDEQTRWPDGFQPELHQRVTRRAADGFDPAGQGPIIVEWLMPEAYNVVYCKGEELAGDDRGNSAERWGGRDSRSGAQKVRDSSRHAAGVGGRK